MLKKFTLSFFVFSSLAQPALALTPKQCEDLRTNIELIYLSYVDRKDEIESSQTPLVLDVLQRQKDRFLKEASQLSLVYFAVCAHTKPNTPDHEVSLYHKTIELSSVPYPINASLLDTKLKNI